MYEEVKFAINIKEPAENRLKKYDKEIQKRFATKIRKLKENPAIHGKPLRGVLRGYWELYFERRYRIIYTIDYKAQIVRSKQLNTKMNFNLNPKLFCKLFKIATLHLFSLAFFDLIHEITIGQNLDCPLHRLVFIYGDRNPFGLMPSVFYRFGHLYH
ncbi:MAG: type II toxin-antitoxin system RelE/ParE family toxin [Methanomicrobia archaeon]|nr:type II toxin-antitoxin system RelE/ParE family toxin [Methanomicrobia archaeon]